MSTEPQAALTPERRARILGAVHCAITTYNLIGRDVAAHYLALHGLSLDDMDQEAT